MITKIIYTLLGIVLGGAGMLIWLFVTDQLNWKKGKK